MVRSSRMRTSRRHFKSSVRRNKYKRNNRKKYSNRKRGGGKLGRLAGALGMKPESTTQRPIPRARVGATATATASRPTNKQRNDLMRFLDAQNNGIKSGTIVSDRTGTYNLDHGGTTYDKALIDLKNGSKPSTSHWIWYCFPQFHAGASDTHKYFQIHDTTEAIEYFNNETLKGRYITLSQLVLNALITGSNINQVMGSDDIKLYSSLYLFNLVANYLNDKVSSTLFKDILENFGSTYDGYNEQIYKKFEGGLTVYLTSGRGQVQAQRVSRAPRGPREPQAPQASRVHNVGLGLHNGGNQCYMNAVIQAFTSIPSIQAKILDLDDDDLEVDTMLYNLKEIISRKNDKIVLRNSENATVSLNHEKLSPIERIKKIIINISYGAPDGVVERYSDKLTEKLPQESVEELKIKALSYPIDKESVLGSSTKDELIPLIIKAATSGNSKSNFNFVPHDVDTFKGRTQQDSSEFLSFLLNYIEFREYFILDRIIENNKIMCADCQEYSKNNYEGHNKLEIPIYGGSVQDSINQYFRLERIDGRCDDDYINVSGTVFGDSGCIGSSGLIKEIALGIFPEVFIFTLGRFGEGVVRVVEGEQVYLGEKITDEIEITPVININGQEYNLQAVVYHSGATTNVGHYTADCLVDGRWINYNDETTSGIYHGPRDNEQRQSYILFYTLGRQAGAQVGVQSPRLLPQIDPPPYSQWGADIARYQSVLQLV